MHTEGSQGQPFQKGTIWFVLVLDNLSLATASLE